MDEERTRAGERRAAGSYRDHYAAGFAELEAIEDRSERSPTLDLMRVSQSDATSDTATGELTVSLATHGTGDRTRFDFSRGRFVAPVVPGSFVVSPAFTDCEFGGGGPVELQIASIDHASLAAIAGEVSDADLATLDVLHSRTWADPAVTWLMHRLWACAGEPDAPHVRLVLEYLHAHLHEPIGVEELAEIASCTRYHFSRLFQRTTGESPQRYLTELRVERASVLLSTTELGVEAVAQRVGFAGRGGLVRAFRRVWGTTPRGARR